ncbi:MAG: thiosulfate oxidation carrier protein SoxY [Gammaproteobacteria bacterium]|nr:thiosulfate oxidation carrier protein SoxY [Gammaproteobacteria bacterium]
MTHLPRRRFLKNTLATAVLAGAAGTGLFRPGWALAAEWPKDAFNAKKLDEAMTALFGSSQASPSAAIKLKVPTQAENSAQVQIQVLAEMPNVEAIGIFVEKNPSPLVAHASFTGAEGYFSARMKMAQTSDVVTVVKAGGKLYTARQNVKVTVGGCGG